MLYHVTATHSPENCPIYNADLRNECSAAMQRLEASATENKVKLRFSVSGAPDHVFYHLVEADDMPSLAAWLSGVPIPQDFTITPVQSNLPLS